MTLPRWLARANRRFVNPRQVDKGKWPVLVHEGRRSGQVYRTPIEAHPADDGYVFLMNYGVSSDWAQNILAAGEAVLVIDGEHVALDTPRVIPVDEAWEILPDTTKRPPSFVGIELALLTKAARSVSKPTRPDPAPSTPQPNG